MRNEVSCHRREAASGVAEDLEVEAVGEEVVGVDSPERVSVRCPGVKSPKRNPPAVHDRKPVMSMFEPGSVTGIRMTPSLSGPRTPPPREQSVFGSLGYDGGAAGFTIQCDVDACLGS